MIFLIIILNQNKTAKMLNSKKSTKYIGTIYETHDDITSPEYTLQQLYDTNHFKYVGG